MLVGAGSPAFFITDRITNTGWKDRRNEGIRRAIQVVPLPEANSHRAPYRRGWADGVRLRLLHATCRCARGVEISGTRAQRRHASLRGACGEILQIIPAPPH